MTSKPNLNSITTNSLGDYGSFLSRGQAAKGIYYLQTDYPPLVACMKQRAYDTSSPWELIGWGTSFRFKRKFSGLHEAKRSARTICSKLGVQIEFEKLPTGDFRIVRVAQPMPSHATSMESQHNRLKSEESPPMPRESREAVSVKGGES